MHAARARQRDVAEVQPEAPLELVVEQIIGQRRDPFGGLFVFGPHDRGAAARERQNRERSGRQEMLLGAAAVVALMRDGGGDGGLAVRPAEGRNAGKRAQVRARAVGRDQQPGRDHPVVAVDRNPLARDREARDGARAQDHAGLARLGDQRRDQRPVLDHVGERLARLDLAREGEEHRLDRIAEAAVGHHHVDDRLRRAGHRVPDADGLEQAAGAGRDRRGARILGGRPAERRVGHHDREVRAEPLAQRDRQREPGKTGAADHDVGLIMFGGLLGHHATYPAPSPGLQAADTARMPTGADSCRPPSTRSWPFSTSSRWK